MDPLTLITGALVSGAAAVLKDNAEQVIKDGYAALKALIKKKWSRTDVDVIDRDPTSTARQDLLKESLAQTEAAQDREIVAAARALLQNVEKRDPAAVAAAGLRIDEVRSLGDMSIDAILATPGGTHVGIIESQGNMKLGSIGGWGNPQPPARAVADYPTATAIPEGPSIHIGEANAAGGMTFNFGSNTLEPYFVQRLSAYLDFLKRPETSWKEAARGVLSIDDLRTRLLEVGLDEPIRVTARGTLFPSALLTAGWWEKQSQKAGKRVVWRDEVQAWLFHGFEVWGPSWDFTFDLENWSKHSARPYFIAQLGNGDEANSIPICVPREKAQGIAAFIQEQSNDGGWFGFEAEVTGMLSHRKDFQANVPGVDLEMFGGLLDYCIWLDEDDKSHFIEPMNCATEIYSGYLWKCVMPRVFLQPDMQPRLQDAWFIWEHTNFANADAVAYNLDSLAAKERYLERRYGKLVLAQKSCEMVPGTPQWDSQQIYQSMLARAKKRF